MPFSRPTLTQLRDQSIEDITTSGVPGLTGLLRNAVLRVLAWGMAGLTYLVYGYADWIARMGVPFTAEDEYLFAWGALIGLYPKDATAAVGQAQFTGGTAGTPLPLGTPLTRQDGTPYTVTTEGTIDATGVVTVGITASVAGAYTNCDPGTPISIAAPIAGINSGGVTYGQTVGGADQETQDEFRTRMLFKYREPPQGGAGSDYIEWALEVPGVTRAWVNGNGWGPGSVVVYPMFDDANAAFGGFPQGTDGTAAEEWRGPAIATGDQLTVAEHIWPVQPVTALVIVCAPIAYPVDVTLSSLAPNTAEVQTGIAAALDDLFLLAGEVGGTVYPSDLYAAMLTVPGIVHFTMAAPTLPIEVGMGYLPVTGTITVLPGA